MDCLLLRLNQSCPDSMCCARLPEVLTSEARVETQIVRDESL